MMPKATQARLRRNPAAIPAGTELFIGFYDLGHTVFVDLIYTNSHTCTSAQDPPGTPWGHGPVHSR